MSKGDGEPPDERSTEQELIATGLPYALQVARRVARKTSLLPLDELEAIARAAVPELAREFDPERGGWKSFVSARVEFALFKALRRERRAAVIPEEAAVQAGLAHVEGMAPVVGALDGTDEEAYSRLVEVVSEVADVVALHADGSIVRGVLAELPPFEADVVSLYYLETMSFRSIAAKLGCTPARAYRAHERAIPKLRRRLRGP